MIEKKNAKIESTILGYEDHGILTFFLNLKYGKCGGQGAGGYALDGYDKKLDRRIGVATSIELIGEILRVVGVDTWEDLPGKHIRVEAEDHKVHGIGHITDDDLWLDFDSFFKSRKLNNTP